MTRVSILSLAIVAVGGLACGLGAPQTGGGDGEAAGEAPVPAAEARTVSVADYATVGLTEPWSSMGLPTDDGHVVVSDAITLLVAYDGRATADLNAAYGAAVAARGWRQRGVVSTEQGAGLLFDKDGRTIALALRDSHGVTLVHLEDRSRVEADNATVLDAKPSRVPPPDEPATFRTRRPSATGRSGPSGTKKKRPSRSRRGKRKSSKRKR